MKQTAVEWLTEKLRTEFGFSFSNNILEQAKEIEKIQIIDAHFTAQREDLQFWDEAKQEALEYYNNTFKNTNNDSN